MAYFAATDVTVSLIPQDIEPLGMGKIMSFPSVAFGNGVIQYHNTTKVPMPAIGNFGMKKQIKRVFIEQPANGYIYHFDKTNNRIRIFLGAARDAITVANHVGVAPTGNLANLAAGAFTGDAMAPGTPTGNLANLAAGAFTGDAIPPGTPTGNLSNLAPAAHSHDLIIAGNGSHTVDADVMANTANGALTSNIANAITIPGDIAANGGIANTTGANGSGVFTGDAMANITPTGNVANGTGDFVGDALANITPTGNVANGTGTFVGDVMANLTHTVTGGGAVAEAPLAEMDTGVAPAAVTLELQVIGQ